MSLSTLNSALDRAFTIAQIPVKAAPADNLLPLAIPGDGASHMGIQDNSFTSSAKEMYGHYRGRVYSAIRVIKQRVAQQPLHVAKVKGSKSKHPAFTSNKSFPAFMKMLSPEKLEMFEQHPILDLFANPNSLMVQSALWDVTVANLCVTGRALWVLGHSDGKMTITPIPVTWAQPVHSNGRLFGSWNVRPPWHQGDPMPVPYENMVHFYFPDPANPLGATSPLQKQAEGILADESIAKAQQVAFDNGIHPAVALVAGEATTSDGKRRVRLEEHQRRQLITWMKQEYMGVKKWGLPIVLDALIRDVKMLSNKPSEMDFLESSGLTKSMVYEGFGVNPVAAGQVEGSNRASSAIADYHLCFTPDTEVRTDSGLKRIDSITREDSVLTHKGRWMPVLETMCRHYEGDMIQVHQYGCSLPINATPSHPILINRNGDVSWRSAEDIVAGDYVALPKAKDSHKSRITVAEWINVETCREKDVRFKDEAWLRQAYSEHSAYEIAEACGTHSTTIQKRLKSFGIEKPKSDFRNTSGAMPLRNQRQFVKSPGSRNGIPAAIELDNKTARVLGLWLAEGSITEQGTVAWSFHSEQEAHLVHLVESWLSSIGVKSNTFTKSDAKCTQVYCYRATLANLLYSMFGKGAHGKRLPCESYSWGKETLLSLIRGYIEGDGSVHGDCVQFTTVSRELAYSMKLILAKVGFPANIYSYENRYVGRVHGEKGIELAKILCDARVERAPARNRKIPTYKQDSDHMWRKVKRVSRFRYDGPVYNLSVNEDESYTLAGACVHNCANAVNPIISLMGQVINKWIVPFFEGSQKIVVWIPPAKTHDPEMDMMGMRFGAKYGAITKNEIRQFLDLPRMEGEEWDEPTSAGNNSQPSETDVDRDDLGGRDEDVSDEGRQEQDIEDDKEFRKGWIKSHSQAENEISNAVFAFLQNQVKQIAQQLEGTITTKSLSDSGADGIVANIYMPQQWDEKLKDAVRPHLQNSSMIGAARIMTRSSKRKDFEDTNLPSIVLNAIRSQVDDILGQPYWRDINQTTRSLIIRELKIATESGMPLPNLSQVLIERFGQINRSRADLIGRTETTGAINSGAQAAAVSMGVSARKEWLSIIDGVTRDVHAGLDGTKVSVNGNFNVGGFQVPYPGHHSLPAEHRCHCRCGISEVD